MLNLNTRSRLQNAGMEACPSPQMSKSFLFLTEVPIFVGTCHVRACKTTRCMNSVSEDDVFHNHILNDLF